MGRLPFGPYRPTFGGGPAVTTMRTSSPHWPPPKARSPTTAVLRKAESRCSRCNWGSCPSLRRPVAWLSTSPRAFPRSGSTTSPGWRPRSMIWPIRSPRLCVGERRRVTTPTTLASITPWTALWKCSPKWVAGSAKRQYEHDCRLRLKPVAAIRNSLSNALAGERTEHTEHTGKHVSRRVAASNFGHPRQVDSWHWTHTAIHWSISWTTGRRQPPRSQLLEPLCRPSAVDLDGTKLHVLITSNEVRQPRDLGGELDGLW